VGEAGLFAKGVRNGVGYCGYIFNDESGLYTVRYRSYSPTLGRWLERDPAGYVDGMGLYEHVRGGPVAAVDPWGLQAVAPFVFPKPIALPRPGILPELVRPTWPAVPVPIDAPDQPIRIPAEEIPSPRELIGEEDAQPFPYDPPADGNCPKDPCGEFKNAYKEIQQRHFGKKRSEVKTCREAKEMYEKKLLYWQLRWKTDRCKEFHNESDGKHGQATVDAAADRAKWWERVRELCNPEIADHNERVREYYRQLLEWQLQQELDIRNIIRRDLA
jgi:RHS repeat-associated protein